MFHSRDTRLIRTRTVAVLLLWPGLFCLIGGCASPKISETSEDQVITSETPSYNPGDTSAPVIPAAQLRIETGMHTAPIHAVAADASERYLATASDDKTVRIWDAHTGSLLSTLRLPIGQGREGEVYTVAVSPDGETIACGGFTGHNEPEGDLPDFSTPLANNYCIYIFDRSSGQILQRILGLPDIVWILNYAPDGRSLAALLGESGGLRVYRTSDYTPIAEDHDYGGSSHALKFDRNGRVLTACGDGSLRLYDRNIHLLKKVKAPGGRHPDSACFSPDGSKIAVGYSEDAQVDVFSGNDLSPLYTVDTAGLGKESVCDIAWSWSGDDLFAAGTFADQHGSHFIRRWSRGGQGAHTELALDARASIWALLPLHDGRLVFASMDPAWGIVDPSGKFFLWKASINDYRDATLRLLLSGDGGDVQLSSTQLGSSPVQFWLDWRLLEPKPAAVQEGMLRAPLLQAPGLNWKEGDPPQLNGRNLPLEKGDRVYCRAIAPDKQTLVLGARWRLLCCNRESKVVWQIDSHNGADEVNISGDGKIAVAAFGDGTVRWYSMVDGRELIALFLHSDRKRWVLWTPSGYYDCSEGGEALVGWQVNNDPDSAPGFFPAARFKALYYRPDVISRMLETRDEGEALRLANAARAPKR